jgi:flavin reductase (DIM6/NTAB) family NADH-FMN oxidoreductase RutF
MEKYLKKEELVSMEQRKRTTLINSVTGFKSLNLIATINKTLQANVAIFNSVIHLGADPALMGFIVRPDSVARHTLTNILETGFFTINHVNFYIYKNSHQTSARYPQEVSEFDACNLTADYKNDFPAPYVKESIIQIGLQFRERIKIELNGTNLVIGEIQQLYFPEEYWREDGYLDIEKAATMAGSGLDGYHITGLKERLRYAKATSEEV